MSVHTPKARVLAITVIILVVTGCATDRPRIYSSDVPHKFHQVAEVQVLIARDEIVAEPEFYKALLAAGLSDRDIQDGSVGVGRVYCCGGKGTVETQRPAWLYIPPGHQVEFGDVVEFIVGKDPDGAGPAQLNTIVKVRHKKGMESGTCRWLPDNPRLWMRVIYCDWMASEGWQKGGVLYPVWFKPAD